MQKIRNGLIVLWMLSCSVAAAEAQVSIGIGLPNVSIGINLPVYPELVPVPGYPVYYAPRLEANFFFYDGMYWIYQDDNWYESSWYNGPWWLVEPEFVPLFILRIPVRYYRQPPVYFRGWMSNAPPRWGEHWGRDWERRRGGWDRWNRSAVPAPAPLPDFQRHYSGDRYPRQVEQQQMLQNRNYRYRPRDPVVRRHYQERAVPRTPAQERQGAPGGGGYRQQDIQRPMPRQQYESVAPRSQSPQRRSEDIQSSRPPSPPQGRPEVQDQSQRQQSGLGQREQQMPRSQSRRERRQREDATREPKRGQEQERERERGRDRNE